MGQNVSCCCLLCVLSVIFVKQKLLANRVPKSADTVGFRQCSHIAKKCRVPYHTATTAGPTPILASIGLTHYY
uniref:Secreted protein n=1 Tax=Globodera rostochiensis TaxID=31243 RepID=A0A914I3Q4_GLORO